jgi:two-component system nitrate/nitrite response regulator NarL
MSFTFVLLGLPEVATLGRAAKGCAGGSSVSYRLAFRAALVLAASYRLAVADGWSISRASCIAKRLSPGKNRSNMTFTCCIVDDSPEFLLSATRLLRAEGVVVLGTAGTGPEALELARSVTPDVILVDVELGDEDGVQVAASLSAIPDGPAVILISTRDRTELQDLYLPGQAAGFLMKRSLSAAAIRALLG